MSNSGQTPLRSPRELKFNADTILLITGCNATGLAAATTRVLLTESQRQYTILFCARTLARATESAEILNHELKPKNDSRIVPLEVDIDDDESTKRLVEKVEKDYGRIDVLMNNAAAHLDHPLSKGEMTVRECFERTCRTNLASTYSFTEALMPLLFKSADRKILFISSGISSLAEHSNESIAINKHYPAGWPKPYQFNVMIYRTSKTGLNMLISELAKMLREDNFKIFIVDPGWLATNLGGLDPNALKKMGAEDPIEGGRFVRKVIEGERDQDVEKMVRKEGSGIVPW